SNIRGSIIKDIVNIEGLNIDGIELSRHIKKGVNHLINTFGLTEAMAKRLSEWFNDNERLFELENIFPEDKIVIKLRVGEQYKPLEGLSVGQKATALLLLLFTQENRILIIDQPEEDLDNRFIYEDVVKILREIKEKRQVIMATHNANIPVLGDSELIVVLNATNDYCKVEDIGSIDKKSIRERVKNIMEGGEEAFKKRAEKYGGL
ncbi:AAA family ATPase, partial [candidate division WOR-3 bacterium]|nr:AAA family ATPase [candidate division WOR-3 bacterium]